MKNLGQQLDGSIIFKPQTNTDREVLIDVLSESVCICPKDLGLKSFLVPDCNVSKCKECWEQALTPNKE